MLICTAGTYKQPIMLIYCPYPLTTTRATFICLLAQQYHQSDFCLKSPGLPAEDQLNSHQEPIRHSVE